MKRATETQNAVVGINERNDIGPLLDQMIVTENVLARTVRETASHADLYVSRKIGTLEPFTMRGTLIHEIGTPTC